MFLGGNLLDHYSNQGVSLQPFSGLVHDPVLHLSKRGGPDLHYKITLKNKNVKNDSSAYMCGEILNIIFLLNEGSNLPLYNLY